MMKVRTLFMSALFLALLTLDTQALHAQTYTVLYDFNESVWQPSSGLTFINGSLYGTTAAHNLGGTIYKLDRGGTVTTVYSFNVGSGAYNPYEGVVAGPNGTLYGSSGGGAHNTGTVYELTSSGDERVLYTDGTGLDGYAPGGLVLDPAGNIYGTTDEGSYDDGNVVKLIVCGAETPLCPETVLYTFTGSGDIDGAWPAGSLIIDSLGNLYGTTYGGGFTNCIIQGSKEGCGTVFKVAPSGKETVLYRFAGGTDGANPVAGLTPDKQGNLYGTTFYGGTYNLGTVFKLDSSGNETILHSFGEGKDGQNPAAGVILDKEGNIYGTTEYGGAYSNATTDGTIFEISTSGAETVLHNFNYFTDGANPLAGLVMDAKGNLYGTASEGGKYYLGTIFELTP